MIARRLPAAVAALLVLVRPGAAVNLSGSVDFSASVPPSAGAVLAPAIQWLGGRAIDPALAGLAALNMGKQQDRDAVFPLLSVLSPEIIGDLPRIASLPKQRQDEILAATTKARGEVAAGVFDAAEKEVARLRQEFSEGRVSEEILETGARRLAAFSFYDQRVSGLQSEVQSFREQLRQRRVDAALSGVEAFPAPQEERGVGLEALAEKGALGLEEYQRTMDLLEPWAENRLWFRDLQASQILILGADGSRETARFLDPCPVFRAQGKDYRRFEAGFKGFLRQLMRLQKLVSPANKSSGLPLHLESLLLQLSRREYSMVNIVANRMLIEESRRSSAVRRRLEGPLLELLEKGDHGTINSVQFFYDELRDRLTPAEQARIGPTLQRALERHKRLNDNDEDRQYRVMTVLRIAGDGLESELRRGLVETLLSDLGHWNIPNLAPLARRHADVRLLLVRQCLLKLKDESVLAHTHQEAARLVRENLADESVLAEIRHELSGVFPEAIAGGDPLSLLEELPRANAWQAQFIAFLTRAALDARPELRAPFWDRLLKISRDSAPKKSLEVREGSQRWYPGERLPVARRAPTLTRLLEDPAELEKTFFALSFLRRVYDYQEPESDTMGAIAFAEAKGLTFPLGELKVVPVTNSYRRHLVYVRDAEGLLAFELKIPGETPYRYYIEETHFTVPAQLWDAFPEDPGSVKPVFYGQYTGTSRLYGKKVPFRARHPLGVMVFDYHENQRLKEAQYWLRRLARKAGVSLGRIRLKVLEDLAAAAYRVHELGWSGNAKDGPDMHNGNASVLESGGAVLSGDYGAYHKPKALSENRRMGETISLLGHSSMNDRRRLLPRLVRRLGAGASRLERQELRRRLRAELNLSDADGSPNSP